MKTFFTLILLVSINSFGKSSLPSDSVYDIKYSARLDLLFHSSPKTNPIGLKNIDGLFLVDLTPNKEIHIGVEIAPRPQYYELDWDVSNVIQFRLGRIWIPFDNMGPSNSFGGVIGSSQFSPAEAVVFLPDLWAEFGIGVKLNFVQNNGKYFEFHLYLVNGLQDGGTDKLNQISTYPIFGPHSPSNADNNENKAFGFRAKVPIFQTGSFGASFYSGRYSNKSVETAGTTMYGVDARFEALETWWAQIGYAVMTVGLVSGSQRPDFKRAGFYASLSKDLFEGFKVTGNLGALQTDDRIIDISDRFLVGGIISYSPTNYLETSAIYLRDINRIRSKSMYQYWGLKITTRL